MKAIIATSLRKSCVVSMTHVNKSIGTTVSQSCVFSNGLPCQKEITSHVNKVIGTTLYIPFKDMS